MQGATAVRMQRKRKDAIRPENGRRPDFAYAALGTITAADITRSTNALFACELIVLHVCASGLFTLAGIPAEGGTVTLGSETYTFTEDVDAENEVLIGATIGESIDNLLNAVNCGQGAGTAYGLATERNADVKAVRGDGNTLTIVARSPGAGGNAIATTETLSNGSFGGATLAGGLDPEGVILEFGDSTLGLIAGFNGDGDLVARFGDGSAAPLTNGARVVIPGAKIPKNRVIRFAVGVMFSAPAFVKVWVDGQIVGMSALAGTLANWASSSDGCYGDIVGTAPDETGVTAAFNGVLKSKLRYHKTRPAAFGAPR
jgi:hypothetical protein